MYFIGCDEVGTGAIAGPAAVACVAIPDDWTPPKGLTDSKKLSPKKRARIADELRKDTSIRFKMRYITVPQMDKTKVYLLVIRAMRVMIFSTFRQLKKPKCRIVADGSYKFGSWRMNSEIESIPKADTLFPAVSAASVIAKEARDNYMLRFVHEEYPEYGFDGHKGYSTKKHAEAINQYGYRKGVHRTKNGKYWGT